MGRIAVIKMNILSRLMFLFQTIPIVKEKKPVWLLAGKKLFKFVWLEKKPRIKMKILCDAKERGDFVSQI